MKHQNRASRAVWTALVLFVAGAFVLAGCQNQAAPAYSDRLTNTEWSAYDGGTDYLLKFSTDHQVELSRSVTTSTSAGSSPSQKFSGTYSIEEIAESTVTAVSLKFSGISLRGTIDKTSPSTLALTGTLFTQGSVNFTPVDRDELTDTTWEYFSQNDAAVTTLSFKQSHSVSFSRPTASGSTEYLSGKYSIQGTEVFLTVSGSSGTGSQFYTGTISANTIALKNEAGSYSVTLTKKENPARDALTGTTWKGKIGSTDYTLSFSEDHQVTLNNGTRINVGIYSVTNNNTDVKMNFSGTPETGKIDTNANPNTMTVAAGTLFGSEGTLTKQ